MYLGTIMRVNIIKTYCVIFKTIKTVNSFKKRKWITQSSMSPAQAHKSSIIDPLAADLPGKYFRDRLDQWPHTQKKDSNWWKRGSQTDTYMKIFQDRRISQIFSRGKSQQKIESVKKTNGNIVHKVSTSDASSRLRSSINRQNSSKEELQKYQGKMNDHAQSFQKFQ